MNKKLILGVLGIIVIALVGSMWLSASGTSTGNVVKDASNENRPVKEFTIQSFTEVVDGKYFPKFSPKEIAVNKGDLVRIKITNIKGTHDFKIDELGVYTETPLDKEMVVEFVADRAGSFEYYCTKPGHRQNGHWGTLKVIE